MVFISFPKKEIADIEIKQNTPQEYGNNKIRIRRKKTWCF
jgi:hypothetical protein